MRLYTHPSSGGRFATFIDDEGEPPCDPPDNCDVCRLFTSPFTSQRPDETRADWLARIRRSSRYYLSGGSRA